MFRGMCGRPQELGLKVRPAFFMVKSSLQFFSDILTVRSWQTARLSSSSGAMEFNEIVRP